MTNFAKLKNKKEFMFTDRILKDLDDYTDKKGLKANDVLEVDEFINVYGYMDVMDIVYSVVNALVDRKKIGVRFSLTSNNVIVKSSTNREDIIQAMKEFNLENHNLYRAFGRPQHHLKDEDVEADYIIL